MSIATRDRMYFHSVLASAKRYGLEWEFITFYKRDRKRGASISDATWYALCEWDL